MASTLSQDEDNYVRMCLLMTGISTRAARIVFDHEMAPSCLNSTLNKKYNILKKLRNEGKINQIQWNLLFRNKPDVPDSKTFDVTLMITLLRHLTDLTPPGGYDLLPSSNETTPLSDLARIKYYRNFLAHLVEEKIEDTEFLTGWDIVTNAISRLGGITMKQECDYLKVKILDQSSREIIQQIKRSNDEIKELKKSMESLSTEMKKLEMSLENTVPWNIRVEIKEILDEWKDNDKMFITTMAAKNVLKYIKENSCVTITASSGVGKTATLKHVALQMELEEYYLLPVTAPDDIIKFNNPEQKTLFVIDNLCGNYSLNQIDIKAWEPYMERIKKILSNKLSKIIVACRLQVYQDEKFKSLSVFMSYVCNLQSADMRLLKAEKGSIAEFYLKTKAPEVIEYYDLYDCFPLLCKLYHANPSYNIKDFFQNPFTVYEAEIDMLQKKGFYSKYCALALCVIFNNNLNKEILTEEMNRETRAIIKNTCEACRLDRGTSRLTLQDDLNSFIHTFLKKEQNIYKAIHDKIFDFLVYYFGKKIIGCLIKNAQSGLISERFLLERQNNMNQFITIVPRKYHQIYTQRIIEDWSKGEVNAVFSNINMEIPQFRKKILCCLNKLDTSYQRKLAHICDVENNDTALLISCLKGDIPMIHWCLNHDVDVNQCSNDEETPLILAVNEGWTETVKLMLNKGADYKKCDSRGVSLVMRACRCGNTEIVRVLLDKGADYNKCDNEGVSPITSACIHGHTEIVRMLLDIGADFNCFDRNGRSPVKVASGYGYTEIVRMLLDTGADCNACDRNGWSPVKVASRYGNTEVVRMLLDKGADYDKCDSNGCSPVKIACSAGHTEVVRLLLDKGADFDKCDNNGWSPLKSACSVGQIRVVRLLLDKGADYDKCDNNGWSPLNSACFYKNTEIVKMLLDIGANYKKCNNKGWSPVMIACRYGHTEIVEILFNKGADYEECENEDVWSPILRACFKGQTKIVRMLLDKGASCNKCNNQGWSPVMIACKNRHAEVVELLFNKGAEYDECKIVGCSPVIRACFKGHTRIVRMLLNKGADYDRCNNDGCSPVLIACRYGNKEIVRMLLDKGADYDKCNNDGCSPVLIACRYGNKAIVRMLLDKGADYNKCNNDGCSPVFGASRYGHTKIVRMLLDKGVDYNKCDKDGCSPVMKACIFGHTEVVKMLLDIGADYNKCSWNGMSPLMGAYIE
ncbi:ankyrin-3-like [Mytilus trossulus]|uniref:ankyrin-3-like n=1 Tax=Mytilus trossulus TaxID=6551 RepID=UPI003005C81D